MSRPKKTEPGHERACHRWRRTMEERYGGKEGLHRKMQEMGAIGGRAGCTGGFYGDPERAAIAGARGGNRSRRGLKLLSKEPDGTLKYQVIKTGEILFLKDGEHYMAGKKYTAEEWANLQKDK